MLGLESGETSYAFSTQDTSYFEMVTSLASVAVVGIEDARLEYAEAVCVPALLERLHPVLAAAVLGVIHSAWHLPLMGHYDTTFGWFLFDVIPLTFVLNWFYLKSRKSAIPVMLLHAGTNVISSFVPTPMDVLGGLGTYMLLRGLVYWGMAITLVVVTKGRLGWNSADSDVAA